MGITEWSYQDRSQWTSICKMRSNTTQNYHQHYTSPIYGPKNYIDHNVGKLDPGLNVSERELKELVSPTLIMTKQVFIDAILSSQYLQVR